MLDSWLDRPSDQRLGTLALIALGVLAVFGVWIQAIEAIVLTSGAGVLDVEFAGTATRMDAVLDAFTSARVLHLEVLVGILDIPMMPGWSVLFFAVHLLGLRALRFLDKGRVLVDKTQALAILPLLAGACDTVENIIILHVLLNPETYIRWLVPVMFILVVTKFSMLFTSMILGGAANVLALATVVGKARGVVLPVTSGSRP